ncbi:putative peptidoglycan glycosyltransferase FtsW [Treponema sp. HNW]|uniref:FtsW/RodA/SpoVE family cell cycle protein n=1 Tax=Treponema sp. HNW TaxID=3116654 RepID=UPI003D110426
MSGYSVVPQKPVHSSGYDVPLIASIIVLLGLGLITLFTSSSGHANRIFGDPLYFVKRQSISIGVGLIFLFVFSWTDLNLLRKITPLVFIFVLILCFLTFIPGIGVSRNGARRWIKLPVFSTFQPSEAAKFAVILFLSNFFAKKHDKLDNPLIGMYPAAFGVLMFVTVIFFQSDFSSAVFLGFIALSMFFIAGVQFRWFLLFFLYGAAAAVLVVFSTSFRVKRLIAFFRPELDVSGINYQIKAACRAISSGGFWGRGIGGAERINAIPEVQADFIFAGWSEAMGLFGVLIYLLLLFFFAFRALDIALKCPDRFRSLCAFGCGIAVTGQSLLNLAVVCGALPTTGIPLPFFSSGGSSVLITLCLCGILINVSGYKADDISGGVYE